MLPTRQADELERAAQYRVLAEKKLQELQPDIELPLDVRAQALPVILVAHLRANKRP